MGSLPARGAAVADSWRAVGADAVIVYIIAFGAMEYLDEKRERASTGRPRNRFGNAMWSFARRMGSCRFNSASRDVAGRTLDIADPSFCQRLRRSSNGGGPAIRPAQRLGTSFALVPRAGSGW